MSSQAKTNVLMNFSQLLADYGDMFFSSGDIDQDYNLITSTINRQGYWAGNAVRYFFDKDLNLINIEERSFG